VTDTSQNVILCEQRLCQPVMLAGNNILILPSTAKRYDLDFTHTRFRCWAGGTVVVDACDSSLFVSVQWL